MFLDLKLIFALISVCITVGVLIYYIRTILRGETQPHSYTWLIWILTQGTAVAGMHYGGGGLGTFAVLTNTVGVALVFLLSLRYGTRNITTSDSVALAGALCAIALWWQLDDPLLSILMVTGIDLIGFFPSYRKTAAEPWSESLLAWGIITLTHVFALLAMSEYNVYTTMYSLVIMIADLTLVGIGLWFRRQIPKPIAVSPL